ncbi:hypothetical protein ACOMHN_050392 [Nucella lapillus]
MYSHRDFRLVCSFSSGRRDARDFRITRAMRGAECWTNHRLVRSVVKLYISPTHQKKSKFVRPSYNIAKFNISENNLPEAQCGFRPVRSTIDMIFAVRQVQEKCREQNLDMYAVFIDLTKAFDTVNRVALWTVFQKLG